MILKQNEFSLESDPTYHALPHLQSVRRGNIKNTIFDLQLLQLNFEKTLTI